MQPILSLGRSKASIPSSPVFYALPMNRCMLWWNSWQQHGEPGKVSPFNFFLWEVMELLLFFFFASAATTYHSLTSLLSVCCRNQQRSQHDGRSPHATYVWCNHLGRMDGFLSPKLEICCERRCLLSPCLLSQWSEHMGMLAKLASSLLI